MKLKIIYSKGIDKKLFYLLLISTIVSYLGYYFYSKQIPLNVYFSYGKYNEFFEEIDLLSKLIRYSRDIFIVLFSCVLMFKFKKHQGKLLLGYAIFILVGMAISFVNGTTLLTIASGIRSYIYIIALSLFFSGLSENAISIKAVERILFLGVVINFSVQMEQAYRSLGVQNYNLIGVDSFRFPGLFGGANGVASYAVGVSLFYLVYDVCLKKSKFVTTIIAFTCCVLISYFSGTRSAMINIILIVGAWLIFKIRIKKTQRFLFAMIVAIIAVPIIVIFVTNIADRGDIFLYQLQNGRLRILINLLTTPSLFVLLFGNGLGAGSNTEAVINYESNQNIEVSDLVILDGTFNVIIYQFGLIGVFVTIVLFMLLVKRMNSLDSIVKYVFWGTVLLQAFTANIFEMHAFLVTLVIVFVVVTSSKFDLKDNRN